MPVPPSEPPPTTLPPNVKILSAASLLNDVASEMAYPLLPQFLTTVLGADAQVLGAIEGAAESTASLLKLVSGAWSDRARSRKTFVVVGYAMAIVVRPLIGLVTAPWQLLAARLADRFGKGIRTSPRDALIAESTPPEIRGRAFGFHQAMDHLGAFLGPLLASAFLLAWPGQLRTLFLLTAIPGAIVLLLLVVGLREPKKDAVPESAAPKQPFRFSLAPFSASFRIYLVALAVFTLGNSSDAFLLLRAGELGVSPQMIPLLWAAHSIAKGAGNLIAGPIVDRVGPRPMIALGWLVYAAVYLAFGYASAAWHVWALFGVYAVFFALTEPAEKALVSLLGGAENKGLAFGWFNFAIGVAALPSSVLFGWIYTHYGPPAAFSWGAALALIASILLAACRPASPTSYHGTT